MFRSEEKYKLTTDYRDRKKMTMIITMAGLGTRFKTAGYTCPKYMIEAKGKTLFEWSMDSLLGYNQFVEKYVFVVRKEDCAKEFITQRAALYNIKQLEILELDKTTDGQATTCMLAIPFCNLNEAIMVYNIDTYVEPYELKHEHISGDGFIPCFHAEGNHWSFVRLDEDMNVAEVREKTRISDNCTLGAYYFSSARLFKELYDEYYSGESVTEKYIAPLYNYMIEKKMTVRMNIIDNQKVHVLGTPEELATFLTLS